MTETNETTHHLIEEAEYFHRSVFSTPISPKVLKKYIAANEKKIPGSDERIRKLVTKKADIEAVEMAWRFRSPRNVLSKKIHILIYLAETTPENFPLFFNTKNKRFSSLILLAWHFFRSVIKFIKGKILLKRYHLV